MSHRGDDPNTIQVGGTHYQSNYQVWDFVENNGLGGLETAIIKYICRWRDKGNARTDLEKAIHYLDKLIDLHKNSHRVPKGCASHDDIIHFSNMQHLDKTEEFIVRMISRWSCYDDLASCHIAIQNLIKEV